MDMGLLLPALREMRRRIWEDCSCNVQKLFNENAPSSLGTITSFGMMGMA
jgi:hypothetical protein